jgi:tetratricopeptide (TPR) repeat protein
LRVATVAGRTFDLDLVAKLADIVSEQAARHAERALRAGLLDTSGTSFAFTSGLLREVLYETTPEPVRASRHRRVAVLLAGAPEAAASHHAAAGDWAAAASAWSAAAEQAMLAFALRDAERLFGEALRAATVTGERERIAELRLRRGEVREELADYDGAHDDHVAALELARALADPRLEARALERLGWTAYYARDTIVASALAARANELAEEAAAAPAAGARAPARCARCCSACSSPGWARPTSATWAARCAPGTDAAAAGRLRPRLLPRWGRHHAGVGLAQAG